MRLKKLSICLLTAVMAAVVLTPGLASAKPVMAVAEFTNDSGAGWWGGGVGEDLAAMLTNELASSGKFSMVERSKMDAVTQEQDLAESGRIKPSTAAKMGQMTGAQYLVLGTVSSYEEDVSDTGGGISIGPVTLGGNAAKAYMAVDLRVVDSTSGEIVFSRTIEGRSSSGGVDIGAAFDNFAGQLGSQKRTPAGKAIRACLVECASYLECVMVDKDGCESEFAQKEKSRKAKTKSAISLD